MTDSSNRTGGNAPDDAVRQVIDTAFAKFCAGHGIRPDALSAARFAFEATAGGVHAFHGLKDEALQALLTERFGGQRDAPIA